MFENISLKSLGILSWNPLVLYLFQDSISLENFFALKTAVFWLNLLLQKYQNSNMKLVSDNFISGPPITPDFHET